jgi:hypothetical protein
VLIIVLCISVECLKVQEIVLRENRNEIVLVVSVSV